ncbi:MAG: MBL fold metallo-hydrolase [Syntrophomonadaceae bacterium]|nr:MBL fold metallo-hydrolase [Syntrophomonadaceae bacterium]MDD3889049.1 MBL fold metallo-hydrolase [Syntrophomonadaceae bacterium]MDD4549405.1 MBL fold metallo-hydrolase [Syntrophomonadaceae bacterium]
MKLQFLGAAKTVTGSFFLLETGTTRFAIDCGLFQGPKEIKERNYGKFSVDPGSIDFLILTHAHIDHIGLTPKLCKYGFRGPIFCSHATQELAGVLLPDSAHIQETEVERKNRKFKRAGKPLLEPIYTSDDADNALLQFRSLNTDEIISLAPGIEIRLRDAGHILGSNIIELWIEEDDKKLKFVFSGDLGNGNQPIVKDPAIIENADYVILETTYGSRYHKDINRRVEKLREVIDATMRKGGNLIIPSFAVERTQDLLYDLNDLYSQGLLSSNIDVYIDSPLAIAATEIFHKHTEYYDDETRQLVESGEHPLEIPNLKFSRTQQESMELNKIKGNTIIISASGMCDAGRIKHHLKHNLWRPESTILLVGYQAEGTLGRRIAEGEKLVKIHGEQVAVKAEIKSIEAYSAHADRAGLLSWLKNFVVPPRGIFLVHGEEESQLSLSDAIKEELNIPVYIPEWLEKVELKPSESLLAEKPIAPDNIEKAILAEKLYLELRVKLNNILQQNYQENNYQEIIDKLEKINKTI